MTDIRVLKIAVITGEHSGDALGASLIEALRKRGIEIALSGVGNEKLAALGQNSYFPQSDIAVMGVTAVIKRLPLLLKRIRETADQLTAEKPDLVITIDSPDFNLRVAKKIRARAPHIPIIHWVCPSVWAWRPKRAIRMRPIIDHILCLLPFEPAALKQLHGPPGTYAGHPLVERAHDFLPQNDMEAAARNNIAAPNILVLPGSRHSIVSRLMPIFGDVVSRLHRENPQAHFILPTVPHLKSAIEKEIMAWPIKPQIVTGEMEKILAFRSARAALAASGTITLELGLAHIPTVAAYRVAEWEAIIARRVIRVPSVILPNLILGENAIPEFLQENCTAEMLTSAMRPLIADTPERAAQLSSFTQLDEKMSLGERLPSDAAAQAVLDFLARRGQ